MMRVDYCVVEGASMADLHSLAQRGEVDKLRRALEKGADVNARDKDGAPPLLHASYRGEIESMKLLIDKGADVNGANSLRYSCLMVAAREGRTQAVRILIDKGANVNAADEEGGTALLWAAGYSPTLDGLKLLLDRGADVNARLRSGFTVLMFAGASVEKAKLLLVERTKASGIMQGRPPWTWPPRRGGLRSRTSCETDVRVVAGGYGRPSQAVPTHARA